MTRSTKSLFSTITVVAAMAATAVPAMGDGYSSVSSIVGDGSSSSGGYSSPTALVGAGPAESSKPEGYSSPTALVGDPGPATASKPEGYSSPTALVGDPGTVSEPTFSTPAAILGPEGVPEPAPQLVSSDPSDGFDWGDAAIGSAIGLGLAAMLGAALIVARRRRPGVQPSV
jgi:hypothetical protein